MKNVIKILYGSMKINNKADYIIIPLKVIYIIFSLPFLVFAVSIYARGGGAFGSPKDEKLSILKKILLHLSNIVWSLILWKCTFGIIEDSLNVKLIPDVFK